MTDGLQLYGVTTSSWDWRTVVPGPSAFTTRDGSAIVWTGRELVVWSGSLRGVAHNPTPADGASLELPRGA